MSKHLQTDSIFIIEIPKIGKCFVRPTDPEKRPKDPCAVFSHGFVDLVYANRDEICCIVGIDWFNKNAKIDHDQTSYHLNEKFAKTLEDWAKKWGVTAKDDRNDLLNEQQMAKDCLDASVLIKDLSLQVFSLKTKIKEITNGEEC